MVSFWRLASTAVEEPVRTCERVESDATKDASLTETRDERIEIERHEEGSEADSETVDESDSESSDITSQSELQAISSPRRSPNSPVPSRPQVSCIQEAQLSPDGTCVFTSDRKRTFSAYFLPSTLLNEPEPQPLRAFAQSQGPDPIWAFATNPFFDSGDPQNCNILISRRNKYISLQNTMWDTSTQSGVIDFTGQQGPADISTMLASYKLVDAMTEAVLAPSCLSFSNGGDYFYAGGKNRIDVFDMNYTDAPIQTIRTIPSARTKMKGGGRGFKGHIAALTISPSSTFHGEGILTVGTRNRFLGLYDGESGTEITSFALPSTCPSGSNQRGEFLGDGVSQLKWSQDGTYLYIAERVSDAILIYDHRKFGVALGYCMGRAAITKQRLGIDIWSAKDAHGNVSVSHEVWAGGTDGYVRIWQDPHLKEGRIEADEVVRVSDGPVVSPLVHSCGYVAAVASGALERPGDGESDNEDEVRDYEGVEKGLSERNGAFKRKTETWGRLDVFGIN